jgi:hypothetical protein
MSIPDQVEVPEADNWPCENKRLLVSIKRAKFFADPCYDWGRGIPKEMTKNKLGATEVTVHDDLSDMKYQNAASKLVFLFFPFAQSQLNSATSEDMKTLQNFGVAANRRGGIRKDYPLTPHPYTTPGFIEALRVEAAKCNMTTEAATRFANDFVKYLTEESTWPKEELIAYDLMKKKGDEKEEEQEEQTFYGEISPWPNYKPVSDVYYLDSVTKVQDALKNGRSKHMAIILAEWLIPFARMHLKLPTKSKVGLQRDQLRTIEAAENEQAADLRWLWKFRNALLLRPAKNSTFETDRFKVTINATIDRLNLILRMQGMVRLDAMSLANDFMHFVLTDRYNTKSKRWYAMIPDWEAHTPSEEDRELMDEDDNVDTPRASTRCSVM